MSNNRWHVKESTNTNLKRLRSTVLDTKNRSNHIFYDQPIRFRPIFRCPFIVRVFNILLDIGHLFYTPSLLHIRLYYWAVKMLIFLATWAEKKTN